MSDLDYMSDLDRLRNLGSNLILARRNFINRPLASRNQEIALNSNVFFVDTPGIDELGIPYNIPSSERDANLNPGGINSFYDIYGVYAYDPNMNRVINPDGTEYNPAYDIEAADEVVPNQSGRRVTRSSGKEIFEPDIYCVNKMDPITNERIVNGFLLEADGNCYDATTISNIRDDLSPFTRQPFTANDILRRNLFKTQGGSKRHSKRPKRGSKRPKGHSKRPKRGSKRHSKR